MKKACFFNLYHVSMHDIKSLKHDFSKFLIKLVSSKRMIFYKIGKELIYFSDIIEGRTVYIV